MVYQGSDRKLPVRFAAFVLLLILTTAASAAKDAVPGYPSGLPLPGSMPLVDYEIKLYTWILERNYTKLGWAVDKGVRDTGPFIDGVYYGTHPAVRIYYSPGVIEWLQNDRAGVIPDGAMIIKEMFTPPAALYRELAQDPRYKDRTKYEELISSLVGDWAIMVRDSQGASDGWFWASVSLPSAGRTIEESVTLQVDSRANRKRTGSQLRFSGFGIPCIRCHASAEKQLTFSDLANIEGYSGEALTFRSDNSWRTAEHFTSYPLSKLAKDPAVKRLYNLPSAELPWRTQEGLADTSTRRVISSDHDLSDNHATLIAPKADKVADAEFLQTFPEISAVKRKSVRTFPPQWLDHVLMPATHPSKFVTSDNCLGCHGGLGGEPSGVTMFVKTGAGYGAGYNVSEYGEWRWSPMGLAGRDPIFHAQLESEMAILANNKRRHPQELKGKLKTTQQAVTNICLSCHGAMGQRQLASDAEQNDGLDGNFKTEYFYLSEALTSRERKRLIRADEYDYVSYGELAREGISCMVCHHIAAPDAQAVASWQPQHEGWITADTPKELAYSLFHLSTGRFESGPAEEVYGPFEVVKKPMENALDISPMAADYMTDSQMCGTCHTINLPNIGLTEDKYPVLTAAARNTPFSDYYHTIEQATFLEWQNSVFGQVDSSGQPGPQFRSCQDCHMPGGFTNSSPDIEIDQLVTQIATIQDSDYPDVENALPKAELTVPLRDDYKRHTHVGLNVFLLSMFDQFGGILGVAKTDYMTSASNGADFAIDNMIRQAQEDTVDVKVQIQSLDGNLLTSEVMVRNKTGHRMPSGVAFRRAFIEFAVLEGDKVAWVSGDTNSIGLILGADRKPLQSEFLPGPADYQPHYEVITSQDQVQIYEELNLNAQREFTTSFLHRVTPVKDNRLLPRGWRSPAYFKGQGQVVYEFMHATSPEGKALDDVDYQNQHDTLAFAGRDRLIYRVELPDGTDVANLSVRATLYYQAIPPYWLKQRFELAPKGEATRRLYYLASHLDFKGTEMENWKLKLVSATDELN